MYAMWRFIWWSAIRNIKFKIVFNSSKPPPSILFLEWIWKEAAARLGAAMDRRLIAYPVHIWWWQHERRMWTNVEVMCNWHGMLSVKWVKALETSSGLQSSSNSVNIFNFVEKKKAFEGAYLRWNRVFRAELAPNFVAQFANCFSYTCTQMD